MAVLLAYVAIGLLLLVALAGTLGLIAYITSGLTQARGSRASKAESYRASDQATMRACEAALRALGATGIRQEGPGTVVTGRKGPSLWSSGEVLTVRVACPTGGEQCQVEARSSSAAPGTTIDWGQNRRNVAAFHACLSRELGLARDA